MIKQLPDKWVRKAIFTAINNLDVGGKSIPCYDSRVTGSPIPKNFIILSTQTNTVNKSNKCENMYESSILIDIVTTYGGQGNTGSRLLADNILDKVRELTNKIVLDAASGLVVLRQTQSFPNDIVTLTKSKNVFRKLMRIELTIN